MELQDEKDHLDQFVRMPLVLEKLGKHGSSISIPKKKGIKPDNFQ